MQSHRVEPVNDELPEGREEKTSGKKTPSWFADAETIAFKKLDKDLSVEVAIVGGGMAGMLLTARVTARDFHTQAR